MRFSSLIRSVCSHFFAVSLTVSFVAAESLPPPTDGVFVLTPGLLTQLDYILAELESDIEEAETKMLLQPDSKVFRGHLNGLKRSQSQLLAKRAALVDFLASMENGQGGDGSY